jgi:putative chitinase
MTDILAAHLRDAFHAVAPNENADALTAYAIAPMRSAGLVTARRAAMFVGQCAEETGLFTRYDENLNYSVQGLLKEFPSHFTIAEIASYAANPEKIGNRVYANRYGNGDEASGDGYRYRGGGWIQITFYDNYQEFGASIGKSAQEAVAFVRTPVGAATSACWYWGRRGHLNELSDAWDIEGVTERINGGDTNLARRILLCNTALIAFGEQPPAAAPVTAPTAAPAQEETADDLNQAQLDKLNG